MKIKPLIPILFLCLGSILSGCSSSKKGGKYGFLTRAYHDMTARFNGYYHAKLRVNENIKVGQIEPDDNYQEILSVFPKASTESGESKSEMEEAIKKASIALQLHPKSKWVDDCYLVIGRANLLQDNHEEAQKSFQYIISQYKKVYPADAFSKSQKKKRAARAKKKEGKNGVGIFDHELARSQAYVYLLESYTKTGMESEAKQLISLLSDNEELSENSMIQNSLQSNIAQLNIKTGEYEAAIEALENINANKPKKRVARRNAFILGQLNQRTGNLDRAIAHFDEVLNSNPDYEMGFYAQLYKLQSAQIAGKVDDAAVALELQKLLEDEKNEEFKGDIYYTLGEIALAENDIPQAVTNFKESIKFGAKPSQKTGAFLKLGDIFWSKEKYLPSFVYYDSCMVKLPTDHSRYSQVSERHIGLKPLAPHLEFIQIQDSLENWSKLSEKERLEILRKNQQVEETIETIDLNKFANQSFELYNPSLRAKGQKAFIDKWGNRAYEDNWRRKLKEEKSTLEEEDKKIKLQADDPDENDRDKKEGSKTDQKWETALFEAGVILMDDIKNEKKAIAKFERLNDKFPDNAYQLESHYRLYQLYKGKRLNDKANGQKALILAKFPNSRIAQILDNPNFLNEEKARVQELERGYAIALENYQMEQLGAAKENILDYFEKSKGTDYAARFMLLEALIIGKTEEVGQFKEALGQVAKQFPEHESGIKAQEILKNLVPRKEEPPKETKAKFKFRKNEIHYFAIFAEESGEGVNQLKSALSDYNSKYFQLDKLKVQSSLFGLDKSVILVKHFIGSNKAVNYNKSFKKLGKDLLNELDNPEAEFFVISKSNYAQLMKTRAIKDYLSFYRDNF